MSVEDLPQPPVPADADLKDYPFTPMYRARLFGSSFHARATDAEWRAGVTLWLKSQDQYPAGSLPNDDIDLCRLAELGRDMKTWRKVKEGALHGWSLHSDGKLYHPVVAEIVNEQIIGKLRRRWSTDCARAKKQAQRRNVKIDLPTFEEWLSQGQKIIVPGDTEEMSQGQLPDCPEDIGVSSPECPEENASNREGEGEGEGYKKNKSLTPDSSARARAAPRGAEVVDLEFQRFWQVYPRREDRGHALKAYRTARKKADPEVIVGAASRYAEARRGQDPKYTALAATWLNGERWADEQTQPPSSDTGFTFGVG